MSGQSRPPDDFLTAIEDLRKRLYVLETHQPNKIGARVRKTDAYTHSSGSGTWAIVTPFNVTDFDNGGFVATSPNGRLVAPIDGLYDIRGKYGHGTHATNDRGMLVAINSVDGTDGARIFVRASASVETTLTASSTVPLSAGDYIELWVWQNSGGNLAKFGDAILEMLWKGPLL